MKSSIDKLVAKKEGRIGWITFNQPEKLNAVSFEMWEALPRILKEMEEDIDIRLVILKGAGEKAFVSGADISQFGEKRSSTEAILAYNAAADAAGKALQQCTKPTLAMVRGYCIGGGTAIAIGCDFRIASDDSRYGVPAGKLGLGYRFTGINRLAQLVGPAFTAEIFFTGRQFSAQEALAMGLINRAVPVAELEKTVFDTATIICNNAPLTLKSIKRHLIEWHKDEVDRDLDRSQKLVDDCYTSEDYKEGRTAFMEKRKPVFTGR